MSSPVRSFSPRSLRLCSLIVLFALPAAAQINLPQIDTTLTLPEDARAALEPSLRQAAAEGRIVLSIETEQQLIELLPSELRDACPRMIHYWGDYAQGTARWNVRALDWQARPDRLGALLAFRCGSSLSDYAQAYDERLALLAFEPGAARLQLIPLAEDCDNCSDLFHLEFSRSFPLPEGELAELVVASSSDNPCCDGPSAWRQEELLYFVLPGGDVALKVERSREDYQHDDENGDWEEICGSTVIDTTVDGRLVELTLHTVCRINGEKSSQEARSYRWNGATARFEALPQAQP